MTYKGNKEQVYLRGQKVTTQFFQMIYLKVIKRFKFKEQEITRKLSIKKEDDIYSEKTGYKLTWQ